MCGATTLSDAEVRIRKARRCFGCTRLMPVGTEMRRAVSVDSDGIQTFYVCSVCRRVESHVFTELDEDCYSYGDLRGFRGWWLAYITDLYHRDLSVAFSE